VWELSAASFWGNEILKQFWMDDAPSRQEKEEAKFIDT